MIKRKRGALLDSEVAILTALAREPVHGYVLAQTLDIPERTALHALNRLEEMGHLRSDWKPPGSQAGRYRPARRVYTITRKGRRILAKAAD